MHDNFNVASLRQTQDAVRIRGLDGLRAIAALMVVLFHLQLMPFGWAGVEVFFVLSGYLITRILIGSAKEQGQMGPYLKRFFWRRSLRIFPLYFAVLGVEIGWTLLKGRPVLADAQLARATYTYNWYRAFHLHTDPTRLASHFWSLASEEQFYLLWPFLVYFFLWRSRLKEFAIALAIAGTLLRAGAFLIFPGEATPWIVYHGGVFQIAPLAIGALVACAATHRGRVQRRANASLWALAFALVGVMIGAAANGFENSIGFVCTMYLQHQWMWGYIPLDLASAALVIACIQEEPLVRALEWKPLRRLGRVSYGFYVFHPFVVFAVLLATSKLALGRRWSVPAAIIATWIAAELSFRFFENPILQLRDGRWFARASRSRTGYQAESAPSQPAASDRV